MAPAGIIQHQEFVKGRAKTYDFTIPDDKLQDVWQSVGVAVLGYTNPSDTDQLCIVGVSSQLCRQGGVSAASIVGDSAKHIYTHSSTDEQQLLQNSWSRGPPFSGSLAFGPAASSVNLNIFSTTLPPRPNEPLNDADPPPPPLAATAVILHTARSFESDDPAHTTASLLERWATAGCVVSATEELTLQRVSPGFCSDLGYSAEQLLGQSLFSLRGPGTQLSTLRALARGVQACCAAAGEGMLQESDCVWRLLLYRGTGEPFQAGVLAMPLPDRRGRIASCWLCVCDITAACCPCVGELTLGRVLGAGAFGTVHIGRHCGFPDTVAVKVVDAVRFRNIQDVDQMRNELAVMQALRHPHIIDLLDVIFHTNRFYIVLECANGGDLKRYIRSQPEGHLSEAEAQRIFRQCVSALVFCHRRHICHRDLKPENILLDASQNCKVADFGLASVVAPGSQLLEYCGTPAFSAPELFSSSAGQGYDGSPADVWSVAVVLYECLLGTLPFSSAGGMSALKQSICSGKYPPLAARLSEGVRDLLGRMLVVDPARRMLLEEIVAHEWYLNSVDGNANRRFRVRMRPTLEEVDRQSDDGASAASAGAPALRQLSLHSSVLVRLDSDSDDAEHEHDDPAAALGQAFRRAEGSRAGGDAAGPNPGGGLPAADVASRLRSGRARFAGLPEGRSAPAAADGEESRLPALKKRSASFSGAKAAAGAEAPARDLGRAKSAVGTGTRRRQASMCNGSLPSIGAHR
eukprot:jgi/Ulvmu1/10309/UM060_0111.1